LAERARSVKVIITDVDGVWTDGGMYYSESGDELKKFNTRDGMAVELLRNAGIPVVVITRESSGSVRMRVAKLGLESSAHLGVRDKAARLLQVAADLGFESSDMAYIGDDVNDLEAMALCGLTATTADGMPAVRGRADYICRLRGGEGAFREFADLVIAARPGSSTAAEDPA
jgi:YrbI family 3-deoxy-D-manno-octulosonate 8-phosphate phosphatase